jgi:hypothetical protein
VLCGDFLEIVGARSWWPREAEIVETDDILNGVLWM